MISSSLKNMVYYHAYKIISRTGYSLQDADDIAHDLWITVFETDDEWVSGDNCASKSTFVYKRFIWAANNYVRRYYTRKKLDEEALVTKNWLSLVSRDEEEIQRIFCEKILYRIKNHKSSKYKCDSYSEDMMKIFINLTGLSEQIDMGGTRKPNNESLATKFGWTTGELGARMSTLKHIVREVLSE